MLVTCCRAVQQSSGHLGRWFDRKGRRAVLSGDLETVAARKAMGGLIELAVTSVDAENWGVQYHSMPLPLEEPPRRSKAQRAKIARALKGNQNAVSTVSRLRGQVAVK